ncbi:unnamed protein product [Phaedon cochleariae]|uniref:Uncharacterized protein n=1 Tax=Phaedon cochleariae TaxID=80249 RepID=A0A9P0DNQ6_PHACE|nr:unnamed protein product [Phaedon cochleariae]
MGVDILFKFVILIAVVVHGYEFPENFKRCETDDKNLDTCLASTIQNAFQLIGTSGITSLGLPSIDPLKVSSLEIGAGSSAVNLVQKYKNARVYGLTKTKVTSAHLDLDKKVLTFTLVHPEMRQEAEYSLNGKILVFPMYGSGDSVLLFKEPTFDHTITFKEHTKNGKRYFHVETYKLNIAIKGAKYDFENLFDGDKNLAESILKVVNENWDVIFGDVKSGVENAYATVFKSIARKFFNTIPVDEIFLK